MKSKSVWEECPEEVSKFVKDKLSMAIALAEAQCAELAMLAEDGATGGGAVIKKTAAVKKGLTDTSHAARVQMEQVRALKAE